MSKGSDKGQQDWEDPVFNSLDELAAIYCEEEDDDDTGFDPKELVEDALTDYADWDVWIEEPTEHSLIIRIRSRGVQLFFPFSRSEVYEAVELLSEVALEEAAEAEDE